MKIAIIGAGQVGRALAKNWRRHGHDIMFGVRKLNDERLRALLQSLDAHEALPADAAAQSRVVVLCLPWHAAQEAVRGLGDLTGKLVIDCMNPLSMVEGVLSLERGFSISGGEMVASWLPGAHVVKSLNQVGAEIMADPSVITGRPVMFVAGDQAEAKSLTMDLVSELGFEALDAGELKQSRILEPFAMVWINQALLRGKGRTWAFGVLDKV